MFVKKRREKYQKMMLWLVRRGYHPKRKLKRRLFSAIRDWVR